jgi:diguanylate cyclase (GGDEF)-like protein
MMETAAIVTSKDEELTALAARVAELESRPLSQFRSLPGPAAEAERRARELGATELVQRARLLRVGVQLREGDTEQGGKSAHEILAWASEHVSMSLVCRAHRELAVFYRQVGDLAGTLSHAVECVAYLPADIPASIRALHLMTLAVALDESGSGAEAGRRSRECLELATSIKNYELMLIMLNNMAYTAYETDDEPAARDLVARIRAVQPHIDRMLSANELDTIARVEMMTGRFPAVEATLHAVLDEDQVAGLGNEGDAIAECRLTLAEARRLDGRFDAAQDALDAALRMCVERGLLAIRARLRQQQAALWAATGRYREAYEEHQAFYKESAALYSQQRDARARTLQAVLEATEAKRDGERFRELAYRDALTGLYNRRHIDEMLPALLHRSAARRAPFSIAMIDLDRFKRVNDTLSHSVGDAVLKSVAGLLAEAAVGPAQAARMGGEEFLLIFPDTDAVEALRCCEQLRLRIRGHLWQPITGSLPVTASIGLTTSADGSEPLTDLLSRADHNLYEAKRAGRDRTIADLTT